MPIYSLFELPAKISRLKWASPRETLSSENLAFSGGLIRQKLFPDHYNSHIVCSISISLDTSVKHNKRSACSQSRSQIKVQRKICFRNMNSTSLDLYQLLGISIHQDNSVRYYDPCPFVLG